jgi:hypothetical protein
MTLLDKLSFQMIKADLETGRRLLGTVDLNTEGLLAVTSSDPDSREFLERLVALINAKEQLYVGVSPPPNAPRYGVYSRGVARFDPQFFDALQAFLAKNYGVFLSAGGPIEEAPFPSTELSEPSRTAS